MKELIEKISSYNLFNYLFPGILYVIILKATSSYDLVQDNLLIGVFLYYFIGLVISRFGSLIIEPIIKKCKIAEFLDYSDYITISKVDIKIELFSEINNMYRTLMALFILIFLSKLYEFLSNNFNICEVILPYLLLISLMAIFILSYRKQTKYIVKRVKHFKKGK